MRILGIDPGTAIMGYGVVDYTGNSFRMIEYGCIKTRPEETQAERLYKIYEELTALVDKYLPDYLAVEELFFNKNVTTALTVGQARGVVLLVGRMKNLIINEYTPLQVKQAVVGYGKAEKKQVQEMVRVILNMKEIAKPDDASDALAIAICHGHSVNINSILRLGD